MTKTGKMAGVCLAMGLAACGGSGGASGTADLAVAPPDLLPDPALSEKLACWLSGRFDSGAQAIADPTYFKVLLRVCPVQVPDLAPRVVYVEQAIATSPKAPYRQRLYVIEPRTPASEKVATRVFELADPDAAIGLCDDPAKLSLTAADALERPGCVVELAFAGDRFTGGTVGKTCESSMNGASYASTEVTLTATGLESWDRGYDDGGQQVWGATKGPYKFLRKTALDCP